MKEVAPSDTTMGDIYKAGLPFLACDAVAMGLIIAFPALALYARPLSSKPDEITQTRKDRYPDSRTGLRRRDQGCVLRGSRYPLMLARDYDRLAEGGYYDGA
jgi:hypothetical protein